MERSEIYGKHWEDKEFIDIFINFKQFTIEAEKEFAEVCAEIIFSEIKKENISILDVGTGHGLVSRLFIEKMLTLTPIRSYAGFDIGEHLIALTRKELDPYNGTFPINLFVADGATFKPDTEYDVIAAFNSWYGIPFDAIKRFRASLATDGVLAILLNSDQNVTIDVAAKFKPEESVTSSEMLMDWLKKEGIPFQAKLVSSKIITKEKFLDESGIRANAKDFFRYILRDDVSKMDEMTQYLKAKSGIYFEFPQHLILIRK